jgi:5-methylcytosine-specific restriction endonuclease McrA
MTTSVIVLNASYEPLQTVSLTHAIKMLCREVAVIEEAVEGRNIGPFPVPRVLRLLKYVYIKIRRGGPRYSRDGVFRRDNDTCLYCGKHANTIDHVLPRSQGGKSTWENSVAACRKCNEKKANRTPKEAGMRLAYAPYAPTFFQNT